MKNIIRKFAKEKRKELDCVKLSSQIKTNLMYFDLYKKSKNVMCYYSFGSEVFTRDFFDDKSKNWYLPRMEENGLAVCPYEPDKMMKNEYSVTEPQTPAIEDCNILDMIIIPAVCADRNGYRIGYGKGCYDRFLKSLNCNPVKVILTFSDLFYDTVYPDIYDEKADYIISEKEIYKV